MEFLASLHPKIVHFPIALLITYGLFETAYLLTGREFLTKGAHILLALGIVGAIAAVLTGNQAEEIAEMSMNSMREPLKELISEHREYATITLWYFVLLLILRTFLLIKKKFKLSVKIILSLLSILGMLLIYRTGDYGGQLVYKHGVGTEMMKSSEVIN